MKVPIQIHFCEVFTGIVLDKSGDRFSGDAQSGRLEFETRTEANAVITDYLEKYPYAECWLDIDGESQPAIYSPHLDEYSRERKEWLTWAHASWFYRWRNPEPACTYYKPTYRGR